MALLFGPRPISFAVANCRQPHGRMNAVARTCSVIAVWMARWIHQTATAMKRESGNILDFEVAWGAVEGV